MNYRILIIIFFISFLTGCEQNSLNKNFDNQEKLSKYKNSGFALVYDNVLKQEKEISKKIDNRALFIFHKNLKKLLLINWLFFTLLFCFRKVMIFILMDKI